MIGYIIQNHEGAYLDRNYWWYSHDNIQDAYVHPVTEIESILDAAKSWDSKPNAVTLATYSPGEGVSVKGKTITLNSDDLRAAMEFSERIAPILKTMKEWQF
jgi:hypothetical protein